MNAAVGRRTVLAQGRGESPRFMIWANWERTKGWCQGVIIHLGLTVSGSFFRFNEVQRGFNGSVTVEGDVMSLFFQI